MDPKHSHGPDRVDYQETPGDLTEVHASLIREHPEPTAQVTPIPMWLTVTCGVAVCWAGLYLGIFHGGFKGDVFNELASTAGGLFPAPVKGGGTGAVVKLTDFEIGKRNYATCQACHQSAGTGTPGLFPPLAHSPFVTGSEKRLAAIMLKGVTGPITVNGATFNSQMQAWEPTMDDKKLATIATYIRGSFGNSAGPITEAQFAAARKEFAAKKTQMTEAEILAIPEDATLPGGGTGGDAAAPATPPANATPTPAASNNPGVKPTPGTPPAAPPAPGTPAASTPPPLPAAAATPEQLAKGKTVYMGTCLACHQATGAGLYPAFPPLTKSPYVSGSAERLVAIILKGNNPPFTIDGKLYAAVPMPPQEALKSDDEIADVATFVRANFENTGGAVTKEQVAAARAKFADRKTPWTQAELDAWKD